MTHVNFDQDKIDWSAYLRSQQVGEGLMMTGRGDEPQVFRGMRYVRGYGSARNVLGKIGRFLLPIASNIAESAKQEAIGALGNISEGLASGEKPALETIKEEARKGASRLGQRLQQCGKGKKQPIGSNIRTLKTRKQDYFDFN